MPVIFDPANRDDARIVQGDSVAYLDHAASCERWGVAISFGPDLCFVRDILGHEHAVSAKDVRLWKLTGRPHPTDAELVVAQAEEASHRLGKLQRRIGLMALAGVEPAGTDYKAPKDTRLA